MKKKMSLLLVLVLSVSLFAMGCSQTAEPAPAEEPAAEAPAAEAPAEEPAAEAVSLEGLGETPVLVTSFGQSADVAMLKALFAKVGVDITFDPVVAADGLGDAKTLFVAAGASTKGLGAAGIKPEDELVRAEEIIKSAKEAGMTIVAVHLGGSARRGDLSDQFVGLAVNDAEAMIVVAEGNEDGYFTDKSSELSIPLAEVDSIAKAVEPLEQMFK